MEYRNKTLKVLEAIAQGSLDITILSLAIASSPYRANSRKINKRVKEIESGEFFREGKVVMERKNIRSLLSKLKGQGLVQVSNNKFSLTEKGKLKYRRLKDRVLPNKNYEIKQSNNLKIIAFDIPERERRKRDWLRGALRELGFKMLQQSVWYGKSNIPEEFLKDLNEIKILDYVDILEVTKTGSIKQI